MTKKSSEIKRDARKFVNDWQGKGEEIRDDVKFWSDLLEVLGVERPLDIIEKQFPVSAKQSFHIDIYLKTSKVVIEQKSVDKSLDKEYEQSDKTWLTPLEQAKRYYDLLDRPIQGRYYIACNFKEFRIVDTYDKRAGYKSIFLSDLPERIAELKFLTEVYNDESLKQKKEQEERVSKTASEFIGNLYAELKKQYKKPTADDLHSLNVFCVRVVFCLFADDAGLFDNEQFKTFLSAFKASKLQEKFDALFNYLATNEKKRLDLINFVDKEIQAFPYVNGGLFEKDSKYSTPKISEQAYKMLNSQAYNLTIKGTDEKYHWGMISPTNFGCIFESTISKDVRDSGGMHYTTPENILRVIEPLFLDDLKAELHDIIAFPTETQNERHKRNVALETFREKLSKMRFLDPACGSGNFLTETYIQLRRLEMRAMQYITNFAREKSFENEKGKLVTDSCKVQISQFYGIEIDDFAVSVARTALWISQCQMLYELGEQMDEDIEKLPLKANNNIVKADALQTDWNTILKPKLRSKANPMYYVIGNPPFQGSKRRETEQRVSMLEAMPSKIDGVKVWDKQGSLDFVCAWYAKAADYMGGKNVETAFVSTNSITQGEQEAPLWYPIINHYNVHISFAWKTFRWFNEANDPANVSCVIIGMFNGRKGSRKCRLFEEGKKTIETNNINGYLMPKDDIFIWSSTTPRYDVPEIGIGNKPIDGGHYLFSEEEKDDFIKKEPSSKDYFHRWYGAEEFLHGKKKYILYLKGCEPDVLNRMPKCVERVKAVAAYRSNPKRNKDTQEMAKTPLKFHVENIPTSDYLIIPCHSSETYSYIPMGYASKEEMSSNAVQILPNATKYMFAVLESSLNMAWTAIIGGKIKSDYRYSKKVIHNNLPWPDLTEEQKKALEKTADGILNARSNHPTSTLAQLYKPELMPEDLLRAHKANDQAVAQAFGIDLQTMTDEDIVMVLARRNMALVAKLAKKGKKKKNAKAKRKK